MKKYCIVWFFLLIFSSALLAGEVSWKFDFGYGPVAEGYTQVTPETVYGGGSSFGLLNINIPDSIVRAGGEKLTDDFLANEKPFYFTMDVPYDGNYRVKVYVGDSKCATHTNIKAESRRIMLADLETKPGELMAKEFIVNVRDTKIKGGDKVRIKKREIGVWHWDNQLTLEFNGTNSCIAGLEVSLDEEVPTIYLAGDSTVTDQPAEPWTSWGQVLTMFFKPDIAIANYAESGETIASSIAEKRFAKIFSLIKPGDYLFIQFAHNDMKSGTPEEIGYGKKLAEMVDTARQLGATPVLVTSMHRRRFDTEGKVVDTMAGYPEAMKAVAREKDVALIDLTAMSREFYEAMGADDSAKAFVDGTHHNGYGAWQLSKCIVQAIRTSIPELKEHLLEPDAVYDPSVPDAFAAFTVPASTISSKQKPDGD